MEPSVRLISEIGIFGRRWRAFMDAKMRSLGVTHARWATLWWIAEAKHPLNQKELARRIGIEGPTLVRQLDILERDGLVERVVDRDRRSRILKLRAAAIPIVDQIRALADELGRDLIKDIDAESLSLCIDVVHRMRARLRERSGDDHDPLPRNANDAGHSIAF